ncbi:MAG TPA: hypothetical protein PKV16_07655 [Caldisericia bacterium]|nr:hypothetical protein [Caldisericia bacterium]HPF49700.1 hypothetical protein [Caldisericia bacterium]HPI84527.1 hypothetical protein [Caldisericia bacterium]HPQ93642.1 hypothetical protein [Caldisericia bacterium]HRV74794.1 hypothetical protein [Caldisericia bacterium]
MGKIINGIFLRIREDIHGFLWIIAISGVLSVGHIVLTFILLAFVLFASFLMQTGITVGISAIYNYKLVHSHPDVSLFMVIAVMIIALLLFVFTKSGIITYFHEGAGKSRSVVTNFWRNCTSKFNASFIANIVQFFLTVLPLLLMYAIHFIVITAHENSTQFQLIKEFNFYKTMDMLAVLWLITIALTLIVGVFIQFLSYEAIVVGGRFTDYFISAIRKAKTVFWETIFFIILHTTIQLFLTFYRFKFFNLYLPLTLAQFLVWLTFTMFIGYPFYILASQRLAQRSIKTSVGDAYGNILDAIDESNSIGVTQAQYDQLLKKIEQGEIEERDITQGDIELYDKLLELKLKSKKSNRSDL